MKFTKHERFVGNASDVCQDCGTDCNGKQMEAFTDAEEGIRSTVHAVCADNWLAWINTYEECEKELNPKADAGEAERCAIKKTEDEHGK